MRTKPLLTSKRENQKGWFEFGKNWSQFVKILDETHVLEAEKSLKQMLEIENLKGKSFLDIGSGSGLFSLAARRLGASVHSFDFDPLSVACTQELKRRYFPDDADWTVDQGDVLDDGYLNSLGQFDVVYSWGVLHHTGRMWQALENVVPLVGNSGNLFISIYNDQGNASRRWRALKRFYNQSSKPVKLMLVLGVGVMSQTYATLVRVYQGRTPLPFGAWADKKKNRGMSVWCDLVDWVGGYPFEVAKPEEIFEFYRKRGFTLSKLKTRGGGSGCNEYVFIKGLAT